MNTVTILSILFIHWVADFVCQTDKMAQGKSKNWSDLLNHTSTYSCIWAIPICVMFGIQNPEQNSTWLTIYSLAFVGATFICHTITDYFTSRLNSKLWADKKVHWFFVSVGFDQILHYAQLFITFDLLTK